MEQEEQGCSASPSGLHLLRHGHGAVLTELRSEQTQIGTLSESIEAAAERAYVAELDIVSVKQTLLQAARKIGWKAATMVFTAA